MSMRKKMLPIGIEDFEEIRTENYYYIDKTGLIAELLYSGGKVNLITRPRRFGKSLNMSMLEAFFSPYTDKNIFDGLQITKEPELCEKYMGKHPVISMSLKGINASGYNTAAAMASFLVREAAQKYEDVLLNSTTLSASDKKDFEHLLDYNMPEHVLFQSLKILSRLLKKHYGRKTVILLDEYDVPLAKAFDQGYYDQMIVLIRNLFENTLKTNSSLECAVLSGCMRISKESIFTGLNNLRVMSVSDERADEYFGFTDTEVRDMLSYYELSEKYEEVHEWYDGYRFGNVSIYCPWDVLNCCDHARTNACAFPENYWINSSGNSVVRKLIAMSGSATVRSDIERLMNGESVEKTVHQELTYSEIYASINNIWSVLFTTGYLTQKARISATGFQLIIPNLEVRDIFAEQILDMFREEVRADGKTHTLICDALKNRDIQTVERCLGEYLRKTISIRDTAVRKSLKENFYHGILLAILSVKADWSVSSNQESGDGYSDIIVRSDMYDIAMILEVKYADDKDMAAVCRKALSQIDEKNYTERLYDEGFEHILKYGIAFYLKQCRVMVVEEA